MSTTVQREYIVVFSWQQWLHECTIMLHYMYIACLYIV